MLTFIECPCGCIGKRVIATVSVVKELEALLLLVKEMILKTVTICFLPILSRSKKEIELVCKYFLIVHVEMMFCAVHCIPPSIAPELLQCFIYLIVIIGMILMSAWLRMRHTTQTAASI